jgi:hypothetical protein
VAGGQTAKKTRKKGEVTLAKEAAARVTEWLADLDGAYIPEAEIALVLKHYAKLTRVKVSRKGLYVKGRAYEYELRDHFVRFGLGCRRVMQSGGGVEKDDLVLTTGWGEEYRLEAKRVAKLPAYLVNPQAHATIFRMNCGESYALVPLSRFTELVQ